MTKVALVCQLYQMSRLIKVLGHGCYLLASLVKGSCMQSLHCSADFLCSCDCVCTAVES